MAQQTDFAAAWLAGLSVPNEDLESGRWLDASFPKTGWTVVHVRDVGPGRASACPICGSGTARFVHLLAHARYSERVEAGCGCAAALTGDPTKVAQLRQHAAAKSAVERAQWFKGWRYYKDAATKRANRGIFRIAKKPQGWEWNFYFRHISRASDRFYMSSLEAKEALLAVWRDHCEAMAGDPS